MQREDIILEWIFLPNKQSKKLKTYVEKISDLILKGKLRLRQLAGIDSAEIVVPLTKEDIEKLWAESEPWQRACSNFLGEINSKYPKSDRIELIKRADWILPRIVWETPISGVRTFYTDANKQGKAGYKSEDLSKVVQSPYNSVQKSELYAILLVLMDFSEPLNIVTDSQYAERVVLHIETAEFIPDESELTSLFIQLQDIIRNRKHPLYITHIRSHTGLPGPLAQGNDEIDKLLIGNVLEASEFHKKHHVNSKGLKRDFSITWQQAKEIVRKCPTCSFYNQTPLPAGCNPKGTQRNYIWQMDVFHFAEFGKLKYVHHTIDTYSGFQWATALSSEKADSVIMHLLEVMAIMGIPAQIKTDNAPAYVSGKMKQFFAYYNIKHITEADLAYGKIGYNQKASLSICSDVLRLTESVDMLMPNDDKVKVKEQLVKAEQCLEKIQDKEVRKSVSVTDIQSEDEEESQLKPKAKKVKVKVFLSNSSSESDSEKEESSAEIHLGEDSETSSSEETRSPEKMTSFNMWWSERMLHLLSIFFCLLTLALCPICGQFWRMFHEVHRRRCTSWMQQDGSCFGIQSVSNSL
ncbi:hypothetical protein STEG23_024848 [Scotinomys teguina]